MKLLKTIKNQINTIRGYDRSVKLFLTIPLLFGMYYAVKGLFFNFYILGLGYDRTYLGLANGMTPAASLILAFPLGILTDRIGRKKAVFIGMIVLVVSDFIFISTSHRLLLLVTLFLGGIGEALYYVAATPLLTRLTTKENRVAIFSLRAALFTFSGVMGSYIGGQLPVWFESLGNIAPGSVASYRGVLIFSFLILLLTLIPAWLIPPGESSTAEKASLKVGLGQIVDDGKKVIHNILHKKIFIQLFIPNLLVGFGAALMVPYLNLYLVETFAVSDQTLGTLFSIASLLTGVGTLFSPWMARRLGNRIRAIVFAQSSSLLFLLLLGFSPFLGLAVIGFWGRSALMNMTQPLYNAFSMEQVDEHEQGALSSILTLSWQTGWALMPSVSGFIQQNFGFPPIFITTAVLYAISTILIWSFFSKHEENIPPENTIQVPAGG